MAQAALNDNRSGQFLHQQALIWASAISFVSILLAFWAWIPSWMDSSRLSGLLFLLPFLLPYGFIPLRLHTRRVFSGLTLAIAMGCALFVPGIYVIRFLFKWERNWWIMGNLILALLMQPVLIVIAAKAFITMSHPPKWRIKFLGSLAYGALLFGLFLLSYSPVPNRILKNERWAESNLCNTASHVHLDAFENAWESESSGNAHANNGGVHPFSFPDITPNADPKCTGYSLVVDPKKQLDGYFFEYAGISPSITAEGCKRFNSFTISARPITYGQTGFRSFFVDESQRVHATTEDRPANSNDPIVLGSMDCPRHTPA